MAAVATTKRTAATADRTVPISSTSQNAMDVTMTGTEETAESQTQSSIPLMRKSTASGVIEEKGSAQAFSKKNDSSTRGGVRFTLRNPPWAYLHLELVTQPPPSSVTSPAPPTPLDHLTARSHLTSALSQFLGLTGTSIPIDILKLDTGSKNTSTASLWIRVPRDDLAAVSAALSSWIGGGNGAGNSSVAFRIRAKGTWLSALVNGRGEDLFS